MPLIWTHFLTDFSLHFFNLFSIRFLLILARFVITPTLNFGALACTRCDFSSLREVAESSKTTSKYLQNYLKHLLKINTQIIKKSIENDIRFLIVFYLQHVAKKLPKWEGTI